MEAQALFGPVVPSKVLVMPVPGPQRSLCGMSPALSIWFHSDLKAEPCPVCPPGRDAP